MGINTDLLAEIMGNLLLFFLVYGMSATVDMRSLVAQLQNKRALLTGVFLQFVVLPFLGFLVVNVVDLGSSMGITLLVITSSPGGSFSNWWCSIFNADLALSVTMTAISTLLSVIMLPLNLLVYATYSFEADVIHSLDWMSLFTALMVVIGAIGLGLLTSAKVHSHKFNMWANYCGNIAGIALIAFSSLMSNSNEDAQIWERHWSFYVAVMMPCLLGLIIANIFTTCFQLNKPERITVSIECCYQNVGIATSVALTMFEGDELAEAMGAPLFYGIVEAVILSIYCIGAWKMGWTKAPADDNFCVMVSTSYEVLVAEKEEQESIEISLGDMGSLPGVEGGEESKSSSERTAFHYIFFPFCGELPDKKESSGGKGEVV